MSPEDLRVELRRLRNDRGVSQVALAQAIGSGQNSVMLWENGKVEPTLFSLLSWVEALGAHIEVVSKKPRSKRLTPQDAVAILSGRREATPLEFYRAQQLAVKALERMR